MMNYPGHLRLVCGLWLALLLSSACGTRSVTPNPVSADTATSSPTLTSTPTDNPTSTPTITPIHTSSPSNTPTIIPSTPMVTPAFVVKKDVPYTIPIEPTASEWLLDVYAPTTQGDWPVVVIFHGGGGTKDNFDVRSLAQDIAEEGSVVFVPSNRTESGDALFRANWAGLREFLENTACAVRFARAKSPEYGGSSEQIVAVGHSGGGYIGMWVTLVGDDAEQIWDAFASDRGTPAKQVECVAGDEVSPLPDVLIGYAGAYVYFDQFKDEDPELFEVVSPDTYIGNNKDVIIRIIQGTRDTTMPNWAKERTRRFYESLLETGYDIKWTEVVAGHALGRNAREAVKQVLWETIGESR